MIKRIKDQAGEVILAAITIIALISVVSALTVKALGGFDVPTP